jgi:hypothetical protein
MCGGLGFGAGGGSLPLDFTAAMTAAIPTSREPMASIAFQISSMSHLLPLFAFAYIIIIAQLSKLYKMAVATRRSNVAASGFISGGA